MVELGRLFIITQECKLIINVHHRPQDASIVNLLLYYFLWVRVKVAFTLNYG